MARTIAAISTPHATGGISIVRLSGDRAIAIADKVFSAKSGERLADKKGYTASFGGVFSEGREIDSSIATVFRSPHSYTGEDVVELSCHGGIVVTRELLRAVLAAGAVLAEAGEFTKRAFLNGKLSLAQAEAVADMITARSREALSAAKSQLDGALSREIGEIQDKLLAVAGHLAAWADYPEEEIEPLETRALSNSLALIQKEIRKLLDSFDTGMLLKEGVNTVIAGRPNVGKSTLMNLLAGSERSIVTDIAGTTRDVVEETINLHGVLLRLSDTAGIRETDNEVERLGVERAKGRLAAAALVLAVFDASEPLQEEDLSLVKSLQGRAAVAVVNKTDLPVQANIPYLQENFDTLVQISAADARSFSTLEEAIRGKLGVSEIDTSAPMLVSERQRDCTERSLAALQEAMEGLLAGMTLDAVTISVETAVDALLELSGGKATEEVVNNVFSHFCVGK